MLPGGSTTVHLAWNKRNGESVPAVVVRDAHKREIAGWLVLWLVAAMILAASVPVRVFAQDPAPPVATDARVNGDTSKSRFVTDLSKAVSFSVYVLPDPYRVIIDLPETIFKLPEDAGKQGAGLVQSFRFGLVEKGRSRVVIDVDRPVLIERSFALHPVDGQPARLVVDLVKTDTENFARLHAAEQPLAPPPPTRQNRNSKTETVADGDIPVDIPAFTEFVRNATIEPAGTGTAATEGVKKTPIGKQVAIPLPQPRPTRNAQGRVAYAPPAARPQNAKPVIVLDPGHGGRDPGAISRNKTLEKVVALAFSKVFRDKLRATGRYVVKMTREDDTFLTLRDRVKFAREANADLFIAIHADSLLRGSVRGATVYTLSEKASDKEAEELAHKENRADIIDGVDLGAETEEITGILIELAQRETKNHSVHFAKTVVNSVGKVSRLAPRPMRSAGFRVLKAPDVPSILLELGYLSSRRDERLLLSRVWRRKMAGALVKAIDRHFSTKLALTP